MDSKQLATLCRELAENRKAENVVVLDMNGLSSVTDYFVIATGSSEPHLRAISSEIVDRLKVDHKISATSVDGSIDTGWLVVDYFDVIVHVMKADVRERYDLESLWGDASRVKTTAKKKVAKTKKPAASKPRKD